MRLGIWDRPSSTGHVVGLLYLNDVFRGVFGENEGAYKYGYKRGDVARDGYANAKHLRLITGTCAREGPGVGHPPGGG